MSWTLLSFGKYKGKTLPEVALQDPDWIYWALFQPKLLVGRIRGQAEDVAYKASRIRIPPRLGTDRLVEYHAHRGRLVSATVVEASTPGTHTRLPYFDLSYPRKLDAYEMGACARVLTAARACVFGAADMQITRKRAEGFFSDDQNFVLDDD